MTASSTFLKRGTFTSIKYNRILIAATLAWGVAFIDSCADSLLAGLFLNETAVSAVSLVSPVSSIVSFLSYLISIGTVAMFSRESGAFHKDKAYEFMGQGFICAAAVSLFSIIAMILIREPFLAYYQSTAEITSLAREYYSCEIFFAAVLPFHYIIYQSVDIDGDEICSFIACLTCTVGNILASYLLSISLGIKGLAYGSIIGTSLGILMYCTHFLRKTNSVHVKLHFNIREVGEVIKISSASSMTMLYIAIIDIIMNRFVIATYGDEFVPAYAVVNFILNLGAIFGGLYDASAGFISVAYGEKNPASIKQTMHVSYRGLIVISLIAIICLELIAPYVPDLYGITDTAARTASVFAVRVIVLTFPALAVYYLFSHYYCIIEHIELGHLLSSMYMLVTPLALSIPLGLIFGFNGMSVGFMLTCVIADLITFTFIHIKYGKKAVPLMLNDTDEEAIFHELYLTKENIAALCEKVHDELTERNIPSTVTTEVQLILEESYMTIMEYNKGKKITTECNLLISDKSIRLITRDNGKIFDITDANAKVKDLRSYVLAQLMERNTERTNTTTISFNRNSYTWNLQN